MRPIAQGLVLLLCASALAQEPSVDAKRRDAISGAIDALASVEPAQRSSARQELLGLSYDELPALRDLLSRRELRPSQVDTLREVVIYVHTRYVLLQQPKTGAGFLGVSLPTAAAEQLDERQAPRPIGMPVVERLCGFVAYRYLEDGDIILEAGVPGAMRPTPTRELLVRSVTSIAAGKPISLRVQRGSRLITITFELDSSIHFADNPADPAGGVQAIIDDARHEAETRITKEFPSLAEEVEI